MTSFNAPIITIGAPGGYNTPVISTNSFTVPPINLGGFDTPTITIPPGPLTPTVVIQSVNIFPFDAPAIDVPSVTTDPVTIAQINIPAAPGFFNTTAAPSSGFFNTGLGGSSGFANSGDFVSGYQNTNPFPFLNFGTSGVNVTGQISSGFMNFGNAVSGMGNVGELGAGLAYNFVSGVENIGHNLAGIFQQGTSS